MKWSEFNTGSLHNRPWDINCMIWLLQYLEDMRENTNPFDHEESEKTHSKHRNPASPFENLQLFLARIELRISRCVIPIRKNDHGTIISWGRNDGKLLEWYYAKNMPEEDILEMLNIPKVELSWRMDKALKYISGKREKKRSYEYFCYNRRGIFDEYQNKENNSDSQRAINGRADNIGQTEDSKTVNISGHCQ